MSSVSTLTLQFLLSPQGEKKKLDLAHFFVSLERKLHLIVFLCSCETLNFLNLEFLLNSKFYFLIHKNLRV